MNGRVHTLRRHGGFSLVELMVAMTLSLVLLAGALSILYSSKVTYAENERIARLQEAGRTVVELILRDARSAGYRGCARPLSGASFTNVLVDSTDLLWNMGRPMNGFNAAGAAWQPAFDPVPLGIPAVTPGSDIVVLRTVREGTPAFELQAEVTNPTLPLNVRHATGATLEAGDTLILNDCEGASVFAVSGFAPQTATTSLIQHVAGNVTPSIGRGFQLSGRLAMIDTVIYYVAPSDNGVGGPALWRKIGDDDPQPLIEGVENLQVLYGVDTTGTMVANQYVDANAVDGANNWDNVVSLTIAVLVRSETETNLDVDSRIYNMLGQDFDPVDDRRQRSLFITTVTLRNRTT